MQGYARIFEDVVVEHAGFGRDEGILEKNICLNECVNHEIKTYTEFAKKNAALQVHPFIIYFKYFVIKNVLYCVGSLWKNLSGV